MENGIAAQILGREEEHTRSAHFDGREGSGWYFRL